MRAVNHVLIARGQTELERVMDRIFGGLAFAGLIAAQFLAVIAVHRERLRDGEGQKPILGFYLLAAILIGVGISATMGSPHVNAGSAALRILASREEACLPSFKASDCSRLSQSGAIEPASGPRNEKIEKIDQ
jgi:hypothetical protein